VNGKIAKEMNVTSDRITLVQESMIEAGDEGYWKVDEDEPESFTSLKRLESNDSAVSSSATSTTSQLSTYPQHYNSESKGNASVGLVSLEKNPVVNRLCSVSSLALLSLFF
jgi:hypothetical protein